MNFEEERLKQAVLCGTTTRKNVVFTFCIENLQVCYFKQKMMILMDDVVANCILSNIIMISDIIRFVEIHKFIHCIPPNSSDDQDKKDEFCY